MGKEIRVKCLADFPKLEDADTVQEVAEFAKSKGLEIDPEALMPCGNIGVRERTSFVGDERVEGREVSKNTFSWAQKRLEGQICRFIDLQPSFLRWQYQIGISVEKAYSNRLSIARINRWLVLYVREYQGND